MTKPDKKNKREYERKQRAEGGGGGATPKTTPKTGEKGKGIKKEISIRPSSSKPTSEETTATSSGAPPPTTLSNVKGEAESGEKLIIEANKRFLEAEEEKVNNVDPKYAKRNITSNWTKYELPSSDESEDENVQNMTGADFNYVLSTAQGAESHFRLKSEQEWAENADKLGELSQEFFSLDLVSLEKSIGCIPLPKQIGLPEESLDHQTLERLKYKADTARLTLSVSDINGKTQEVTEKLMNILKTTSKETEEIVHSQSEIPRLTQHLENLKTLAATPNKDDPLETKPFSDILQYAKEVIQESKEAIEDYYADQKQKAEQRAIADIIGSSAEGSSETEKMDPSNQTVNDSLIPHSNEQGLEQRTNRRLRGQKYSNKAINEILCLKGTSGNSKKTEDVNSNAEADRKTKADLKAEADLKAAELNAKEIEDALQIPEEYKDFINNPDIHSDNIILNEDLEFLESLDKEIKSLEKKENMPPKETIEVEQKEVETAPPVVSVKITKEETTQKLEDWLDDFLDE